jgi:hypothetical protein
LDVAQRSYFGFGIRSLTMMIIRRKLVAQEGSPCHVMPIYIARVKKWAKTLNSSFHFGLAKLQTDLAFLANCKQMFVFHILLMFAKLAN